MHQRWKRIEEKGDEYFHGDDDAQGHFFFFQMKRHNFKKDVMFGRYTREKEDVVYLGPLRLEGSVASNNNNDHKTNQHWIETPTFDILKTCLHK